MAQVNYPEHAPVFREDISEVTERIYRLFHIDAPIDEDEELEELPLAK